MTHATTHGTALCVVAILSAASIVTAREGREPARRSTTARMATAISVPSGLVFEPNLGQAASEVRYLCRQPGGTIFLTDSKIVVALRQDAPQAKIPKLSPRCEPASDVAVGVLRIGIEGARAARVSPGTARGSVSNYFLGSDPRRWITHVPHESSATWVEALPGIDVRFHGDRGPFEFDLLVSPEAIARAVSLAVRIDGADSIVLDALGNLRLRVGTRELVLGRPVAWQENGPTRLPVRCEYALVDGGRVELRLAGMKAGLPLVIDPTLAFSTYLGGTMDDAALGLAVDAVGASYLSGATTSLDFPAFSGVQPVHGGGSLNVIDGFVSKLASDGTLEWSTFIGGSESDDAIFLALDAAGRPHVTGSTESPNFPVVAALQPVIAGSRDAYVLALSAAGDALIFSTYHGGDAADEGVGIALEPSGAIHVSGVTRGGTFPLLGAAPLGLRGGGDMFLSKLAAGGASLIHSTIVGGSSEDLGWGLAVNSVGESIVVGPVQSADFPLLDPVQTAYGGDSYDIGFARLDATGGAWLQSSLLGGSRVDGSLAVAFDASDNAVIAGTTGSPNFPMVSAFQPTLASGADMTLTLIDAAGDIARSTFVGGAADESTFDVVIDSSGAVLLVGTAFGPGAFDVGGLGLSTLGGPSDAIVVRVDPTWSAVTFATSIGGSDLDLGQGVALSPTGDIVVAGTTMSADFPTVNATQSLPGGGEDAFIARISFCGAGALLDLDQDGLDDRCATYRNHGDYVSAVAHACHEFGPPAGYTSCGSVVRTAARSDIGK